MIKNIFKEIELLFFPVNCVICHKGDKLVCRDCISKAETEKNYMFPEYNFLDNLLVLGDYKNEVIKKMIWEMKYNFNKELVEFFSLMIAEKFKKELINDFVFVSVPLHKKRHKFRGFNQSDLIAKSLAEKTNIIYLENTLRKNKVTQNQAELSKKERLKNNTGVFEVRRVVKSKNIFLVDDVITTGATIKECVKVLKEAGANKVWGVVLAKD